MKDISFHFKYYTLENPFPEKKARKWILNILQNENKDCGSIDIIFVDDANLLNINKNFLKHDYYTDIITFDYTEDDSINGDIFISLDRVIENAQKFKVVIFLELKRVLAHGILHLCGYNDKKKSDVFLMREKENYYINLADF